MYTQELKKIAIERIHYYKSEPEFTLFCSCRHRSCADEADFYVQKRDDKIVAMRYCGEGCILSHVSAHIFCEAAQNQTILSLQSLVTACLESINSQNLHEMLSLFQDIPRDSSRTKCYQYIWKFALETLTAHHV